MSSRRNPHLLPTSQARELPSGTDPRAALLAFGSPTEILSRLAAGDPLGLVPRTRTRVRARALLIDPRLILPRVRALVARRAFQWRGEPPLERFLETAIDAAIDGFLEEASERATPAVGKFSGRRIAAFARLPIAVREAFVQALLEGVALDGLAAARRQDLSSLGRDLRQAIDCLVPASTPAAKPLSSPGRPGRSAPGPASRARHPRERR